MKIAWERVIQKRGNYDYIKTKSEEVFYDPAVATKEIVDEVFETVNDRNKLIKTLAIAKSAIRHNMAKDLPKMSTPTCLIWGKNDGVTHQRLLQNSTTYCPMHIYIGLINVGMLL